MSRMSTILIVDDDPRFRTQARDLLAADGFDVVGQAVDGASGLEAARSLRPDFVLLDIGLPDVGGFAVARALAGDRPAPLVVLTSSRDARAYGRRLTDGDCLGFIPKELVSGAAIRALVERE
jgi:DNA-binding NarL/FixJ family response regulator